MRLSSGRHLNRDAVGNACKYNGYFAIRTGAVAKPSGSLAIYRERNVVATSFRRFKAIGDGKILMADGYSYKGKY